MPGSKNNSTVQAINHPQCSSQNIQLQQSQEFLHFRNCKRTAGHADTPHLPGATWKAVPLPSGAQMVLTEQPCPPACDTPRLPDCYREMHSLARLSQEASHHHQLPMWTARFPPLITQKEEALPWLLKFYLEDAMSISGFLDPQYHRGTTRRSLSKPLRIWNVLPIISARV